MTQIQIKGPIVSDSDLWFYDWLDMPATAPKDIILPQDNSDVEVIINSGGGDVYAGSEIYTALKSYQGNLTVKIVGIAASAASVIAMAGDTVEISPTAQIMIHNVSTTVSGDHKQMLHEAGVLENYNTSIANAYVNKTGLEMTELLDLMGKETWFTAQQAVEKGFADKEMFAEEIKQAPQLVAGIENVIPSEVISKLANAINVNQKEPDIAELAIAVSEYNNQQKNKVEKTKQEKEVPKGFGAFCF
ncbi:head maturation protease, ClpP-related [Streptococcus iniae]|uniref:head maturation protease, ClpP-related n=1 Tax=Streptococcus iniae TaxID=1346 RepID=UPI000EF6A5A6|nr:head maturation protease, ClpP-related [Streptococcus iniae]RLV18992.1 Clp protease ClpP [Streptococcus iniae]